MGAWGAGNFENDDALDWAATLEDANDLSSIEQALQAIAGNDDYLEAPDCSVALAAAEVVAALRNPASSHDEFPDQ